MRIGYHALVKIDDPPPPTQPEEVGSNLKKRNGLRFVSMQSLLVGLKIGLNGAVGFANQEGQFSRKGDYKLKKTKAVSIFSVNFVLISSR